MSTHAAPADTTSAGAPPRPRRRTRHNTEGPSQSALEALAAGLADKLRRDARAARDDSRFDRRLYVLDLLHRDPQLLAETVLELAETAVPPPRR